MSDVQRIRQQIDDEATILRLLATGFKTAASHETITASMDRMGKYQEKLKDLIGEDEANNAILTALGKDDEVVTSLEVTIPDSYGEMMKVLSDHGGSLELGEKIVAKFSENTRKRPSPYSGYDEVEFEDGCSILYHREDHALLLDLPQYL
jgi:hypothetical protein